MERPDRRHSRTYNIPAAMKKLSLISSILSAAAVFVCCDRNIPTVSLGIDDVYNIARMQKLSLVPALTGERYRWTVNGETVAETKDYIFLSGEEGSYNVSFEIIDAETPYFHRFTVNVFHEEIEYSPYISKVHEYRPAPGQFINEMPGYEDGDTESDMIRKAEESISGRNDVMISLGGFGGYVTFSFDHTVINIPGQNDFRIWGNSFYELTDTGRKGGSAEPGIVMVSFDSNCNGIPDDEWFELAGSEYDSPRTKHHYRITYHRPDPYREITEDESGMLVDVHYIRWTDSEGSYGYMAKNRFHSQEYFPKWIKDESLTFSGSILPPNAIDKSGDGSYYILYCYDWGYVDNHPNDYPELNSFDISNARNSNGEPVKLPGIDFIRVYTGVNQYCGWLGETSTEICRAQDLHISPDNFQ